VTYPGFTPVGNATLVVANVLTCNKHSPKWIGAQKRVGGSVSKWVGVCKALMDAPSKAVQTWCCHPCMV
jgi:hypothetical protein